MSRSIRTGLVLLLVCSASALFAATAAGTAPSAKSRSPWQLFGGAKLDIGRPLLAFDWAANRVWVATATNDVPIMWSARASGGRLRGFVQTRIPADAGRLFPIVAGELLLPKLDSTTGRQVTTTLLDTGRLGPEKTVAEDVAAGVKQVRPELPGAGILGGVRLGGRVVWLVESNRSQKNYYLACCGESGAASDLSRFFDPQAFMLFVHLGVDSRGRLWVAWLDTKGYGAVRGRPRILELDPSTLAPRSSAAAIPGLIADRVELACGTSCRLVAQSAAGDIVSWAPGERSTTHILNHVSHGKFGGDSAFLLAATYRGGGLAVAYDANAVRTGVPRYEFRVSRGDARGANAQVIGAIPRAETWPPQNVTARINTPNNVSAAFAPAGLVTVETFLDAGGSSPVVAAIVPLGR